MTATTSLPFSDLELVGYIGRFQPRDWPLRLLPVYCSSSLRVCLLPPTEEDGESLKGRRVPVERLEELEDEGEVTRLQEPLAAQRHYLLWMSEEGPRYMPREAAESALDEICYRTVDLAMEAGLRKRTAREQLFRSLRARPTAVATALLSLHFQLQDDLDQTQPLREDLARMATQPESTELERRLLGLLTSQGRAVSQEEATAVAVELRRARREPLAQSLLDAAQVRGPVRWAAQSALPLRWGALRGAPS